MAQTLYVVVYASALGNPSAAQIAAGQDATSSAATWANGGATWTGSGQYVDATGLSSGTSYKAAAAVYDSGTATYSNVVVSSAFVTALTVTSALLSAGLGAMGAGQTKAILPAGVGAMG